MANMYFKGNFEECAMEKSPLYLYIDDVEDFLKDCGDEWISDNVDKKGIYQWNSYDDVWVFADPSIEKKIKTIVEQNTSCQSNNISVKWNILITLNTNETIQTNSEPVPMNEVHEAIDILLRPSFFGKTIKEFKIVAV
jgi:predicted glycosyltransferase